MVISLIVTAVFCVFAWYKKWLDISGALAAFVLATVILSAAGWILAAPMILFFISGSLLSRLPGKTVVKDQKQKQPRDYVQVLCNGGIAGACALFFHYTKSNIFIEAYFVSIAISNSDTWSSETGNYCRGKVFDIVSLKPVQKGLSGGISFQGTMAGLAGAFIIALLYMLLYQQGWAGLLFVTIAGFAGMLADSFAGSLFQARYLEENGGITEQKAGNRTLLVHGVRWMNNDAVNFISNMAVTLFAMVVRVYMP